MNVKEFRLFSTQDPSDGEYFLDFAWSRPYEYRKMIDLISDNLERGSKIHNTSWGFEGSHVLFKEKLDSLGHEVLHSDIRPSSLPGTCIYDIAKKPRRAWRNAFDAVLNVSTVEEVKANHWKIINNLYSMVKPGGHLFITFDLPGLQHEKVSAKLGTVLQECTDRLTGTSSKYVNPRFAHLTCGVLVIQKSQNHLIK